MSRKIVIDTEDLKAMLDYARGYRYVKVYDSDANTDGEGVWHCDVDFFNFYDEGGDPASDETYSFDEYHDKLDDYNKAMRRQAEVQSFLASSLSSSSASATEETPRNE